MDSIVILFYLYSFLLGVCVASFMNVVIWRVPREISIAEGRSFCPQCEHKLAWLDLIPILSYVFLKGKCRYCGDHIPIRDTIIEFIGGLIGIYCFYLYQFSFDTIVVFSIMIILLTITMIDFDTMIIPNGLLLTLVIPAIFMMFLHPDVTIIDRLIGFACISVPMYLLILVIPDCFGGGDVKLFAVGGLMLGWKFTLLAAMIAILLGGIYATYLIISKKARKGVHIAFGPYICIGFVISLIYGVNIVSAYLALFGL